MHEVNKMLQKRISTQVEKVSKLSKLAWDVGILKNFSRKKTPKELDVQIGKMTYNTFKTLGPTFVKIGQFISTRSDIFGKDFTEELKLLQDNVKPMTPEELDPIRVAIAPNFEFINEEPIAAASIGQVHYGKLKNGTPVAVKFKRVGIDETINDDFKMLLIIIEAVKTFASQRQIMELEVSLKEYYALLMEEINFKNEVANMKEFKKQFRDTKWIKVPTPFDDLCTNDVIVMEYVPAVKIDNIQQIQAMNFSRAMLCQKLLECFFTQIVQFGFVHIDPHPGNMGISTDGKLVFYDYGMFVKLDGNLKQSIRSLFLAVYDRDVEEISKLLMDLNIITVEPAKEAYFKKFVASFLVYIDNLDINDFKLSYIDKIDASETQFLISSKFILLLRGISILEGVCKTLYPSFNYREILEPFVSDFIIDIDYIERRGMKDISRLTTTSDKLVVSEISLGMMEKDMETMKKKLATEASITKQGLLAILVALQFQVDNAESQFLLGLAFLYIICNR